MKIAREVSHTTLQRRMHDLKTRLGATTRFQAGLQAALRGWITDSAGGAYLDGQPRQLD